MAMSTWILFLIVKISIIYFHKLVSNWTCASIISDLNFMIFENVNLPEVNSKNMSIMRAIFSERNIKIVMYLVYLLSINKGPIAQGSLTFS